MIGAAQTYRTILAQLLIERELAGGDLSEDEESRFVEELDRCWWAMTLEEHQEIEAEFAVGVSVEAPSDLHERDRPVTEHMKALPREPGKAA